MPVDLGVPFGNAIAFVVLLLGILTAFWVSKFHRSRKYPYPPGPTPKFLVGNVFDMPKSFQMERFAEWSKKYDSDILYANAAGSNIVIVNSAEIAEQLFEKRSQLYNDRPTLPIVKLLGWDYNMSLMKYGPDWRDHRKLFQQLFNPKSAERFLPIQIASARRLLRDLLEKPEDFEGHFKMMSVSATLMMMYGYKANSARDPAIVAADAAASNGASIVGSGATLFTLFPWLCYIPPWFPFAATQKKAAYVRHMTQLSKDIPLDYITRAVQEGSAIPSVFTDFLERKHVGETTEEEERIVHNTALTTYSGAAETTVTASMTLIYVLATNPQVVQRAQAELDQVIGLHRLPELEDRPSLPYIEAIYRELLRFSPPLPGAITHALTEDDVFDGYLLPKGSLVIGNVWAMTHNELKYPDPMSFKPERFFTPEGKLNGDDHILAYGFGRRVCVGKHVASTTMWLAIAYILACFDLGKAKDKDGNEIEIKGDFIDHRIIVRKAPFQCSITPRSEAHRNMILNLNSEECAEG